MPTQGLAKAEKDSAVETRVYPTNSDADRTPNLQAAAQAGYGLVFANGVLIFGATPSRRVPEHEVPRHRRNLPVQGKPANIRGVQFRRAGGRLSRRQHRRLLEVKAPRAKRRQIISAIGANKVTAIVRFFAGYNHCAKRAYPKVKVLNNYASDPTFNDQTKCRTTALGQIARGTRIIFTVAGGCGLGALEVRQAEGSLGIGVDADQSFLGPHILTSATKQVNVAVYDAIKESARIRPASRRASTRTTP